MKTPRASAGVDVLVDHLFRQQAGRMVAVLTRTLGPENLDLVEDVVQEALTRALRYWPFRGVPDDPAAWLYRVARNRALDVLRRRARFPDAPVEVLDLLEARLEKASDTVFVSEIADDELRLIFTCCHPAVQAEARVALTLKTVCGFGVREIAQAFLAEETTIAQRLVRAKRRLRDQRIGYAVPAPDELPERLRSVLDVIYLLFNKGYAATGGDALVQADICRAAIRLVGLVAAHPVTGGPAAHALAALLHFHVARLPTRLDDEGELLLLEHQDRGQWDRQAISAGFVHLRQAGQGEDVSDFHLQAGIAACHAAAEDFAATDWSAILGYYDQLVARNPSPVLALNRAVACAMLDGPAAGLEAVAGLEDQPALARYYLLPATRAEFLRRLGRGQAAGAAWRAALDLDPPAPVRRFIERRLAALRAV